MQRPTSVTVFGILNLVFAVFGLLGIVATAMMFVTTANTDNPVIKLMQESPALVTWTRISIGLGVISTAILVAAGIGLLKLKPWARTLSLVYAVYAIIMIAVSTAMNYLYLVKPMLEQQSQGNQNPAAAGAAVGGAIGGMCGGCAGMIYPILLLIFMMRANVVAAFRQDNSPSPPPQP